MFAIEVEFLEGRVIAARPDNPAELEWPLEPARLFMALVAAHFEGQNDDDQAAVLAWLQTVVPDQIIAPPAAPRNVVTVFVPVNDRADDPNARSKQPRTFPSAYVGDRSLIYRFDRPLPVEHQQPLQQLLAQVVRIGHSASLVRCSLLDAAQLTAATQTLLEWGATCWLAEDAASDADDCFGGAALRLGNRQRMRVASDGFLSRLASDYNGAAIDQYAELSFVIAQAPTKKEANQAKKNRDAIFPAPPSSRRPIIGVLASYRSAEPVTNQRAVQQQTVFEPTLIPLAIEEGNSIGLESTLQLTAALRAAILSQYENDAPPWVCGHEPDGSVTTQPHLALVPLPFVGSRSQVSEQPPSGNKPRPYYREYADGHLLGLGIVLPRQLTNHDKSTALGSLLFDDEGLPQPISLTLKNWGNWTLRRETRVVPPQALVPETWSRPSRFWASVTPIVLDRHPKSDRLNNAAAWLEEAAEIIGNSCQRLGLSPPLAVRVLKHGPIAGVPSSRPDRSGFPPLPYGDGSNKSRRQQIHAVLEFASPVQGPLLIGAGRFRGYGFCKPIEVPS